jgi:hypothetical protein
METEVQSSSVYFLKYENQNRGQVLPDTDTKNAAMGIPNGETTIMPELTGRREVLSTSLRKELQSAC